MLIGSGSSRLLKKESKCCIHVCLRWLQCVRMERPRTPSGCQECGRTQHLTLQSPRGQALGEIGPRIPSRIEAIQPRVRIPSNPEPLSVLPDPDIHLQGPIGRQGCCRVFCRDKGHYTAGPWNWRSTFQVLPGVGPV
jgi:hypothetical protein